MPPWLRSHPSGSLVDLHIVPGSSKNEIVGTHGDRLKIKIKAPPEDGEANIEILNFLSERLQLNKQSLEIIKGLSSRQKTIHINLECMKVLTLLGTWP